MHDEHERQDLSVEQESSIDVSEKNEQAIAPNDVPSTAKKEVRVQTFTGSYVHGIDIKGRMIVPVNFRTMLGSPFVVAPTMDMKNAALYPYAEWVKIELMLEELLSKDVRAQRYIDQFNKYSYVDCEMDAQGRLLLPQKIRNRYLADAKLVDISGAKSHIRVIECAQSANEDEAFLSEFPDPLAFIAQLQK